MPAPTVVERGHIGYPQRLGSLSDAPRRLWVVGELSEGPAVAIVGSRSANRQGLRVAQELAADLARAGVTVISGGARGIDWAAHTGALDGGGRTTMVLGCGHDVDYPKGSAELRSRAAASGAVVSELPPDAKPRPLHFPKRNRIVAALADAVVVVQAGERSGALVTARIARRLGVAVLAVPGLPNAPLTRGTHGLLRSGRSAPERADDVLTAIGSGVISGAANELSQDATHPSGLHEALMTWLDGGPASADELARGLQRPVSEIVAALVELEMEDLVCSLGGCYERRGPLR